MKSLIGYIILASLGVVGAPAYARVYQQIDPDTGVITYSNFALPARRAENPSTPAPVVAPSPTTQANNRMSTPPAVSQPTESATGNFPRVSAMTQKERDSERRRILNAELSWEHERTGSCQCREGGRRCDQAPPSEYRGLAKRDRQHQIIAQLQCTASCRQTTPSPAACATQAHPCIPGRRLMWNSMSWHATNQPV
jgi:hypothetical protein